MIRFFKWLIISVVATGVFLFTGTIGFVVGQVKYISMNGSKGYFKYLTDMIAGIFKGASFILEGYSLGIDVMANASGGEGLEWICTTQKEDTKTLMGVPDATISAGIGDMSRKGFLDSGFGKGLDKVLNVSFNQKDHSGYALDFYEENKKLQDKIEPYFGND